jgi:predicted glycoside hydrolase/deacetylase ChbG (UPF0249 family)
MIRAVNVPIPEPLFERLKRVAARTFRPIEEVLSSALDVALPIDPDLPQDVADELAAMSFFSDEALQAAVQSSIAPAQAQRLRQLSHDGGERTLSMAEQAELDALLQVHDVAVLRRAKALAILAQRGHSISDQTKLDSSAFHVP